jgi:hypothetical protein
MTSLSENISMPSSIKSTPVRAADDSGGLAIFAGLADMGSFPENGLLPML